MTPDIRMIPLSKLHVSARNVRKTGGHAVEDLAASIAAHGLLQNLVVTSQGDDFEIDAGRRRYGALQLLLKRGQIDTEFPVPCKVIDETASLDASLAENTKREAMHPADEFDAFRALVERGDDIASIAAAHGVTEAVVRQRLKLAKVSPRLIKAYRDDEMTLQTLQTFAVVDGHKHQEKVWGQVKNTNVDKQNAHNMVRRALLQNEVEYGGNAKAEFVGLDAYRAAGGMVRQDLFGGEVYVSQSLIEKLADEKLQALRDVVAFEGWAWVNVVDGTFYGYDYGKKKPGRRKDPEVEAELEQLKAQRAELIKEGEQLVKKKKRTEADDARADEIVDLVSELDAKIEATDRDLLTWSAKAKAESGAVIALGNHGLKIHRGLISPADLKRAEKAKAKAAKGDAETNGGEAEDVGAAISAALACTLSARRTAAIQAKLLDAPHVAKALIVYTLLRTLFRTYWSSLLHITLETSGADLDRAGVPGQNVHRSLVAEAVEELRAAVPETEECDGGPVFAWLLASSPDHLDDLLAVVAATAFNGILGAWPASHPEKPDLINQVSKALSLDMAQSWKADEANYFGRVPKALMIEAVTEACGAEAAKPLSALKKPQAAQRAAELVAETGWLPPILRIP